MFKIIQNFIYLFLIFSLLSKIENEVAYGIKGLMLIQMILNVNVTVSHSSF